MTAAVCVTTVGMLPVIRPELPRLLRQSGLLYRQQYKMHPSVLPPPMAVQRLLLKPTAAIRKNAIVIAIVIAIVSKFLKILIIGVTGKRGENMIHRPFYMETLKKIS